MSLLLHETEMHFGFHRNSQYSGTQFARLPSSAKASAEIPAPGAPPPGDPRKIADVVLQLANSEGVLVRLILGVDAERRMHRTEAASNRFAEAAPGVSRLDV